MLWIKQALVEGKKKFFYDDILSLLLSVLTIDYHICRAVKENLDDDLSSLTTEIFNQVKTNKIFTVW